MPPPSFRPLLVAMAMTLLVAGLVVGGWALIFGFVALTVTLLQWLRDARREYVEVEDADRTGHLESGPAPAWPTATFAVLAWVIAGGLLLTSGLLPNSQAGEAAPSGAPVAGGGGTGGSGAPPSAAPSLPAADTTITAQNTAFVADLGRRAGRPGRSRSRSTTTTTASRTTSPSTTRRAPRCSWARS